MIRRIAQLEIERLVTTSRGRMLVVTGARQVGKSTLVRASTQGWDHVDLDDPISRRTWAELSAERWLARYRRVVVDEIQKLPELFETMKACHDRDPHFQAILLGSSQTLVLRGVRESLAGRAALRELFPLTLSELSAHHLGASPSQALEDLLTQPTPSDALEALCDPILALEPRDAAAHEAWDRILHEGAMPAPSFYDDWSPDDRREWLEDYVRTYLQRDLADVARIEHMEPFVRLLRLACLRTAQTANWSDLGREAGVSGPSVRNWMAHLEASYHAVLLQPWFRNPERRLARAPKIHILDAGVRRAVLRRTGSVDGAEFETSVFGEIWKRVRTSRIPIECFHLRTSDGREVDLLLETPHGYFALECKSGSSTTATDARHFEGLDDILDKPLLAGIVVGQDPKARRLRDDRPWWAIPAWRLLG
jgi:hypothetical protein